MLGSSPPSTAPSTPSTTSGIFSSRSSSPDNQVSLSPPPPGQHITLHILPRRARPKLTPLITRLRYPLAPLHPLPNGAPHPAFPPTLLHFHLLTEDQLDSIAAYYHQRPRGPRSPSRFWTGAYPAEMRWDDEWLEHVGKKRTEGNVEADDVEWRVGIKRRKVGRFIGLRSCETPAEELAEYQEWRRTKEDSKIKGDDLAFWGSRGWRT